MEGIKKAITELEKMPQQPDLIVGCLSLCKILKTTPEQVAALVWCSQAVLAEHPIVALKILKIALLLGPEESAPNAMLQDVLKRRGRWVTEQRLAELSKTTLQTSAASDGVPFFDIMHSEQDTGHTSTSSATPDALPDALPDVNAERSAQQTSAGRLPQASSRFTEFLSRCGFSADLARYAQGMSNNNCGLVTFVGVLQRLSLVKPSEMPLALHMLRKMIDEEPDNSEALLLYTQMFDSAGLQSERES